MLQQKWFQGKNLLSNVHFNQSRSLQKKKLNMSLISTLQSSTLEKTFSYLEILGIPFLQRGLEQQYQAIQVHLCLLLVQFLLSILGALSHSDLYKKTIMYIKLTASTNTDVQNRNTSCRCSSLQGLPSAVFLVLSWKLDRVLLNLALIHHFQRQ